jgi:hypothetical protein
MSEMEILIFGGIFTETSSDLVPSLVASTGLTAAASRYAAVLAGGDDEAVERATAVGFFSGLGSGGFVLLLEALT